ncbi:50S ribosomal protein L13 [Candidatus Marinamargulisbacteria bacterium SCGC AG-333-B06]|nr:50S ribosomal protein L13 [Candidatus Marinamargulisbacteria bacterium SCGC AG-333-B06]
MKKQKTNYTNKKDINPKWLSIDADGQVLGRLASQVAKQLIGKNSVQYTPSVDVGDFVIVYNAKKIMLKGNKADQKVYYRHSRYPGGLKEIKFKSMLEKKPEYIIMSAVKGMLPKNRLGKQMLTKLKVFSGEIHDHEAQKPELIKLKY